MLRVMLKFLARIAYAWLVFYWLKAFVLSFLGFREGNEREIEAIFGECL